MADDIVKRVLLEVFSDQLLAMRKEWERLIGDKDEIHFYLQRSRDEMEAELEKL